MSDSEVFTSEDPLSVLQKETEEIELLLATLQPTSGPRNHTEETLLPSTSRPAPFPTSDTRNQTEETALLPSTSRPALFPTSDTRNQTEATALLPSTSQPALFSTSDSRNQTEATALLPSTSRSSLSPIRTRNHGVSPAASDEEVVSGADEDLAGPSSIRIEDRALREAIRALDVASVKSLLARDAPLTHVADGTTPLHLCMETYWGGKVDVST